MSPAYLLTRLAKLEGPENTNGRGLPGENENSGSKCQKWITVFVGVLSKSGVNRRLIGPSVRIFAISLRDIPVIADTREMLVGRPRKPNSSVATSTKTAFTTAT